MRCGGSYGRGTLLIIIEEFGFADPLVVNSDMTIIGGHQRLTVAQDLGYTEVPCAVVDIDKVREKALNIALNKILMGSVSMRE